MNEWQLQTLLTEKWAADGVVVNGSLHLLVAWEVMAPSWRINDASEYWSEPSIDFLVADKTGSLAAIELKMAVPGVKPAWRALCQVAHRAVLLRRTFSLEALESAYVGAHSGRHGRVSAPSGLSLAETHRRFFDLEQPVPIRSEEMRRIVAATAFGPSFEGVLKHFNGLSASDLTPVLEERGLLRDSPTNREPRRLVDISPTPNELRPRVAALMVDVPQ